SLTVLNDIFASERALQKRFEQGFGEIVAIWSIISSTAGIMFEDRFGSTATRILLDIKPEKPLIGGCIQVTFICLKIVYDTRNIITFIKIRNRTHRFDKA